MNKTLRKTLGILLHIPSLLFAILYWTSAGNLYPENGAIAFGVVWYWLVLSLLFGAAGVALWRGKFPWK